MPEEAQNKIQWHPGFEGALELRLRDYRDDLEFRHSFPLSKLPMEIDTLVIVKKADVVIEEDIAAIFRKHNIVEYKSPDDALSIEEGAKRAGMTLDVFTAELAKE